MLYLENMVGRRSADSLVRVLIDPIFRNARTRLSALHSCASSAVVRKQRAGFCLPSGWVSLT